MSSVLQTCDVSIKISISAVSSMMFFRHVHVARRPERKELLHKTLTSTPPDTFGMNRNVDCSPNLLTFLASRNGAHYKSEGEQTWNEMLNKHTL